VHEAVFEDGFGDDAGAFRQGHEGHVLGLHVRGETGVGPGLDVHAGEGPARLHHDPVVGGTEPHPGLVEFFQHRGHRGNRRVGDGDPPPGDGRGGEISPGLDAVAHDGVGGRGQRLDAVDGEDVGADAFDVRAHGREKPGQIRHFGLLGGVDDSRDALGQGGGHHQVFRARDRGQVQGDVGAVQPFGFGLHVALVQGDLHPHGLETFEVLVDGPGPDGAAAGQGDAGLAGPGHQRPQDQDRGPHGLDRLVGGHPAGEAAGINHQGLAVFKLHPHEAQELFGGANVGQGRHIVKPVHPRGQQRGRDDGQGGVLGPADGNFPRKGYPAFNDDFVY